MPGYCTESDVRRVVREELRAERRLLTRPHAPLPTPSADEALAVSRSLLVEVNRLKRLLRAACSTLESSRIGEAMWSGELAKWRREDRRGAQELRATSLEFAYAEGERD